MSDEQLIATPGVFGENGNFLLERELGKGGMGGVYMGRDKMLDRPVAVKVMLRQYGEDAEFVDKFKKEAQAAARLIHPNIAQIYSYGISDGMPYIAMELVAGGALDALMRNSPGALDIPRVMKICEQVAQALRCAADQGLVHGDVKPENILLDANGNAKLVDFGLAAMQKDTDEIWGTPYYIAPEKVKREIVDYRADMYSLGCTIYHALTGVAPFEGEDPTAVVRRRFEGAPQKPSEIRADISPKIDALVMKMIALNKEDRFPSFEALLEEFKNVMTSGLTTVAGAPRPTPAGRRVMTTRRPLRRKTTPTAAAAEGEGGDGENGASPSKRSTPPPEDEGGNVGAKVARTAFIVIGAIVAIVGGLVWYQIHDKEVRAREHQAKVVREIGKARNAIENTRGVAEKYVVEVENLASNAVRQCQAANDRLVRALPEVANHIKPVPTKELLDAQALLNPPEAAPDAAAQPGAAANVPAATPAPKPVAVAAPAAPRFRAPVGEESDPNSPEGEEYLKQKAAFEAKQKAGEAAAAPAAPAAPPAATSAPDAAPSGGELSDIAQSALADMRELWNRAYSCQASAIKIRVGIDALIARCAKADELHAETEDTMNALGKMSGEVTEMYNALKGGKEEENIRKGSGYIRSRGETLVKKTLNRLFVEKREAERKAAAEQKKRDAEEKAKREAEERAQLVAKEQEDAKAKFQAIVERGTFRILEWESALRELEYLKADCKTPEGEFAVNLELQKVRSMKYMQDIFVTNLKGYAFRRGALAKELCKVIEVDSTEIRMATGRDGRGRKKLTWSKLYAEYHGNLNELIIQFVEKGRENAKPKLTLRQWADAMVGAALSMQIICGDDASAADRGRAIAVEVAKKYEDYVKPLKQMFPNINFDEAATED